MTPAEREHREKLADEAATRLAEGAKAQARAERIRRADDVAELARALLLSPWIAALREDVLPVDFAFTAAAEFHAQRDRRRKAAEEEP